MSDMANTSAEAGGGAGRFARPHSLAEALDIVAGGGWRLLAGGTDLFPATQRRQLSGPVLDITAIEELRGVEKRSGGYRIGACTPWRALIAAPFPPAFDALKAAARVVGGRQIQASGTIGGNLCNASPAADGAPPLLALDASVELASADNGMRRLALQDFILGPRRTALAEDEILTAVTIPEAALGGASAFEKLGARAHLVISIAMAAARLTLADGRIASAAVAIGACSPAAVRLRAVEMALEGVDAKAGAVESAIRSEDIAAALSPIDDPRATASYRLAAADEIVRRAVGKAMARAQDAERETAT